MRRETGWCAAAALALVVGLSVEAREVPGRTLAPMPVESVVDQAEQDAATLRVAAAELPAGDRLVAEKLLADAEKRLEGVRELATGRGPRLAQRARKQVEVATRRIEAARRIVEQQEQQEQGEGR